MTDRSSSTERAADVVHVLSQMKLPNPNPNPNPNPCNPNPNPNPSPNPKSNSNFNQVDLNWAKGSASGLLTELAGDR